MTTMQDRSLGGVKADDLDEVAITPPVERPVLRQAGADESIDFGKISASIMPAPAVSSMPPPMPAARTYAGDLGAPQLKTRTVALAASALVLAGVAGGLLIDAAAERAARRSFARSIESNAEFLPMTDDSEDAQRFSEVAASVAPRIRLESASVAVIDAKEEAAVKKLPAAKPVAPTSVSAGASERARASDKTAEKTAAPKLAAAALPAPAETERKADLSLPAQPSREAVQQALLSVRPAVMACAGSVHGQALVEVSVGPSGRVRTATVGGAFAGTKEGSCIARAVRTAKFPAFSRDDFRVTFPYQL